MNTCSIGEVLKLGIDIPDHVAEIFKSQPDIMVRELVTEHGITDYKARIYRWIWNNGHVDYGLPIKIVEPEEEVACRHAIMACQNHFGIW